VRILYSFLVAVSCGLLATTTVQAQTALDPSFKTPGIYEPGEVYGVQQLSSGARIIAGRYFNRVDKLETNGLVQYRPDGQLDRTFLNNVAANEWDPRIVKEAAGGKLFVSNAGGGGMSVSGQQCQNLVRLNPDGTLDTSYPTSTTTNSYIYALLVQPDGKVVISGSFSRVNGETAMRIARLNADGTLDVAFTAAGAGFDNTPTILALQPDGKIVAGGYFTTANGQAKPQVARLNVDGSLDLSFDAHLSDNDYLNTVTLQPDGKVLLSSSRFLSNGSGGTQPIIRLLPSGAIDRTFVMASSSYSNGRASNLNARYNISTVQVQPDGKIVVAGGGILNYDNSLEPTVIRLLPSGAEDPSFQCKAEQRLLFYSVQVLNNGQILLGGTAAYYTSHKVLPTAVGLLNADGSYDPSFAPLIETAGQISDMAVQPDGKIVIGGRFSAVGDVAVRNLARLNADGTLDAAFSNKTGTGAGEVVDLALQADGKVLAAGSFREVSGVPRQGVARLLPTGALDESFVVKLSSSYENGQKVAVQPDGQVLLVADKLMRLSATGAVDVFFRPATNFISDILVQPDGRILVVGSTRQPGSSTTVSPLVRLLSDGSLDASFKSLWVPDYGYNRIFLYSLGLYPDGRILAGGRMTDYGSVASAGVIRLLPDGTPDNTFLSGMSAFVPELADVRTLLLQPNNRILIGGALPHAASGNLVSTLRLLSDGKLDASYDPFQAPPVYTVDQMQLQPDGRILLCGDFETAGGKTRYAIARLTDANVLRLSPRRTAAQIAAFPNPAHSDLHVSLDVTEKPHALSLLDMTGRVVLTHAPAAELTLPVHNLAPGVYLLRVDYAAGPVTQRVVVQ